MITLTEVIEVERPVEACFRYVSDFRTTVEWDATAVAAQKLSPGPVGKGSHFSVVCKAGPTKLTLDYCITEFTPWQFPFPHWLRLINHASRPWRCS